MCQTDEGERVAFISSFFPLVLPPHGILKPCVPGLPQKSQLLATTLLRWSLSQTSCFICTWSVEKGLAYVLAKWGSGWMSVITPMGKRGARRDVKESLLSKEHSDCKRSRILHVRGP